MVKVLQICAEMPPYPHGGIGTAVGDLAPELTRCGIDLHVVGLYPNAELKRLGIPEFVETDGYRVTRLPKLKLGSNYRVNLLSNRLKLYRFIQKLYKNERFDLILCDDFDGFVPMGAPRGAKLIVRLNGSNFIYDAIMGGKACKLLHWMEKRTLREADAWIGVSEFFLKETEARIAPRPEQKRWVIPNPVDTTLFSPVDEGVMVKGRIFFHNSLGLRKGIYDLFDAFPGVVASIPEAHLEIHGDRHNFAAVKAELLSRVPASLWDRIRFHGRTERPQLPAELGKAHVACYPSHLETFGIGPVEAMAMERLTIYSSEGPGPEVMVNGKEGLLCPPKNVATLTETLIKALRMGHDERRKIGRLARLKAVERFDRSVIAQKYCKLFDSMF
ncbi:MAG: glycosyltransferase family 4 protein [Verrucomicrobiales bacterium]|nr:glycosyltransferase family 4 protein [Verrucomicrobiales bacterium]